MFSGIVNGMNHELKVDFGSVAWPKLENLPLPLKVTNCSVMSGTLVPLAMV
jgi:hypothetical protein